MLFTTIPAKSVVEAQTSTSASGRLHRGNSSAVVALLPSPFTKCPTWSVPMGHASMPTGPVPAGPAGPAGPGNPLVPLIPGGPCGPGTVLAAPAGPVGPIAPVNPLSPWEPGAPGGPCGPVWPPAGPGGPCGPCVPVILLSFLSSLLSSNLICLQNSTELTKNPSNGPVLHWYLLSSVGIDYKSYLYICHILGHLHLENYSD